MFNRYNPPGRTTYLKPECAEQVTYDFTYDKDHNLIVEKTGTINYDKLTAAAAEGCDFTNVVQSLRAGAVSISKGVAGSTPGKGVVYGVENEPTSIIDADRINKAKAKAARDAFAKLPEDLKGGMTLNQFAQAVDSGYLDKYIKMKETLAKVETKKEGE